MHQIQFRRGSALDPLGNSGVTNFGGPGKHSLRALVLVLIHNSGHFLPPLPFWAPALGIAGAVDD